MGGPALPTPSSAPHAMNQDQWRVEFCLCGWISVRRQTSDELFHFDFLVNLAKNGKPLLLPLHLTLSGFIVGERKERGKLE
jgi:hypothetical protein